MILCGICQTAYLPQVTEGGVFYKPGCNCAKELKHIASLLEDQYNKLLHKDLEILALQQEMRRLNEAVNDV